MAFHEAEAQHSGGSVDQFVGENSPAQYLNFDSNSRDSFGSSVDPCSRDTDRAVFSNKWPRYGYNYEADEILGGHPMTESQPDQQHHQLCHYHSNDAPASAVLNENSSDSTSQGLVGASTAASTAGTVSERCETVETAALTARRMVSPRRG